MSGVQALNGLPVVYSIALVKGNTPTLPRQALSSRRWSLYNESQGDRCSGGKMNGDSDPSSHVPEEPPTTTDRRFAWIHPKSLDRLLVSEPPKPKVRTNTWILQVRDWRRSWLIPSCSFFLYSYVHYLKI